MHFSSILRRMRMVSGLVLLLFVTMHLVNLGLGLRSLDTMEQARPILMGLWEKAAGVVLLSAAVLVHGVFGLWSIAMRRSLAMSRTDWVQMVLGLVTTPLLVNHVILVQVFQSLNALYRPDYGLALSVYWKYAPVYALLQVTAVVAVWIHGAIGLYTALVLKPIWTRIGAVVTPLLFVVPIAALLGFVQAGKEAMDRLANDAAWQAKIAGSLALIGQARGQLEAIQSVTLTIYAVLALSAIAVLAIRVLQGRARKVAVNYDGGQMVQSRRGLSILEASLLNNIPHAHVCSGRGRCGTCLVEVIGDPAALSAPNDIETQTLERIHAAPGQRLACQARLMGAPIGVVRLRPAYADASAARNPEEWATAPVASMQVAP
jgi:adenylate cyclase